MARFEVVEVEPQPTAVVVDTTTVAELSGTIVRLLDEVYAAVRAGAVVQAGQNVVLYLDGALTIEAGIEVAGPFEPSGRVVPSQLPGGRVARAVHVGPYHRMAETHEPLTAWCRENGHALAGPSWEVYGDWVEDESKLETEIRYLLRS
jgi:effector-binding domain-containing protein